jgi:hypothetical protein
LSFIFNDRYDQFGNILFTMSCGEPDMTMFPTTIKVGESLEFTAALPDGTDSQGNPVWRSDVYADFCAVSNDDGSALSIEFGLETLPDWLYQEDNEITVVFMPQAVGVSYDIG